MKVTAIIRFLVMILMAGCAHVTTCSSLYANETDRLSLLEFKKAISLDPQQALMSWNDSTHLCNWEGVHCSMKNPSRVTSLELTNRGLVGPLSHSLGNLTLLKYLNLSENTFTTEIPPSLGHLRRLQYLVLSNNTLQGRIPSFANSSRLKVLLLNGNNLVGRIPGDWPPKLQKMSLSANKLTITIPSSLANITMLNDFRCSYNKIEGDIPNEFAKFHRLQFLYVAGNRLAGRFPQAILNLSTLVGLSLAINNFGGELPPNLGNYLPNLQQLYLARNFFHGHIPPSLTNASKLYLVLMSSNSFTGVVPGSIGKLTKLSQLNLERNKLEAHNNQDWEFISSLANCTKLEGFSIAANRLEGHIPSSLGNLSVQLVTLYLGRNKLSGSFPCGIQNFPNLTILALDNNQFTGVVPEWLGSLRNLQEIWLNNNMFTGFIPTSLSNLSRLRTLHLGSNKFGGHIPPSLGSLPMLGTLAVSDNNLHDRLPKEILTIPTIFILDFSFNNFYGELPSNIGNAKHLTQLHVASNKLSGEIPHTLGNCRSLETIELGMNIFNGSIPTSFGDLSVLKILNLSYNHLTGSIPTSLGDLQLLEQIDLSFNHLEGEAPAKGIFNNVTATWVDGNPGICGGAPQLHLQSCSIASSDSAKQKHSFVLKVVIPVAIVVLIIVVICVLLFSRRRQMRKHIPLPSFGMEFPKISYNDLAIATEGFSACNLIGRGSYSSVYQGRLFQHRKLVAVKVFSLQTRGAQESFIAECNALRNVRHRNLVPILTTCSSIDSRGNDFKALVFEFMPRGDLHKLLHSAQDDERSSSLNYISLAQRLSIVVDVADALEYLHHNNQGTIVHFDLKPSNILLDDNMAAHVGDFGLARLKVDSVVSFSGGSNSTSSIAIKGTIGYVAPECATGGYVSTASDVFSFGIVLLEIFLRKRPVDDMFKDGLNIPNFVESEFPEETLVDTKGKDLDCLLSVLNIGLCCTKLCPNERPNMRKVAARLHGIKEAYLTGTKISGSS